MIRTASVAVAVLAGALAAPAHALRCDSRVIARGDYAAKVLHYCGEPEYVQSRVVRRALFGHFGPALTSGLAGDVQVEEWTYNFGPNKLMPILELENGIVTRIRYLGYGYTRD
jgi:Protein of unknown function (DUF2845)